MSNRVRKGMPLSGLKTAWPADAIGDQFTPNARNVRMRYGEIRNAPGRLVYDSGPVAERALAVGEFALVDGTTWLFMFTDNHLYRRGNLLPSVPNTWNAVTSSVVITGSGRWSWTVGEGRLFACKNGPQQIMTWDGLPADQLVPINSMGGFQGIGGGANAPVAKFLEYFNNRVVAAYVTEGGNVLTNRIRWPESGNFLHWNETLQLGAGFLDLWDTGEPITGIKRIGERLAIYKRHQISELIATGDITIPHQEQIRVHGIGLIAPYTLASNGHAHFFLGKDFNVWSWNGVQLQAIGNDIYEQLRTVAHMEAINSYHGFVAYDRQEYWLVIGTTIFIYDYIRKYWITEVIDDMTVAGEADITTAIPLWNGLTNIWQAQSGSWEDHKGTTFTEIIAGSSLAATYLIHDMNLGDRGNAVDKFVETEDLYLEGGPWDLQTAVRLLFIYTFVNNSPWEVSVSNDHGVTWNPQTVVPTQLGYSFVDFRITGNVMRFRFRSNDVTGQIRWRGYIYEYVPAGDFIGTTT